MKKLVPEYAFNAEQLHIVSGLAKQTGLTEQITRILYARGIDTAQNINTFMHPSRKNFLSPFLMRNSPRLPYVLYALRVNSFL